MTFREFSFDSEDSSEQGEARQSSKKSKPSIATSPHCQLIEFPLQTIKRSLQFIATLKIHLTIATNKNIAPSVSNNTFNCCLLINICLEYQETLTRVFTTFSMFETIPRIFYQLSSQMKFHSLL
jgi:hypothetical protein